MNLLEAVMFEPLEVVIDLFQRGITENFKKWLDYEALNKALEFGRIDVVDFFLSKNCRVNRISKQVARHNTPLHNAVKLQDINVVKRILKHSSSVIAQNAEGDTPLHLAFNNQDMDIVDAIFEQMKYFFEVVNPRNKYGLSHMHIACERNQIDIIKFFLDSGEDIAQAVHNNAPSNPGFTPLHFAVKVGDECMDTVELLLSRGADPFLEDAKKCTAHNLNEERMKDSSLMQHFLTKKKEENRLPIFQVACLEGKLDYIETFLEMGVDVNESLTNKSTLFPTYTPLHFAVENGNLMCIETLQEYGADINATDSNSMTPLHLALYKEKTNVVKKLFSNLPDPCIEKVDSHGLSYFHVAVTQNRVDLVQKYLERKIGRIDEKVRRNKRNFSNFTPLHFGVKYKCMDTVRFLLEKKANINCNDDNIYGTPLHIAVEEGDLLMINLLLDHGASTNVKRLDDKRTPLHLLVLKILKGPDQSCTDKSFTKEENIEALIKRLVIQGGSNNIVNDKDIDGNTPLHMACSKIRVGIGCVKALLRWGASLDQMNSCDNTPFQMSFNDNYHSNAEDYMILYDHVQKLKDLGFWIDHRNLACCKRLLREKDQCDPNADYFTEYLMEEKKKAHDAEIQRLKVTKIHQRTSLYNLVWDDVASLKSRVRSNHLETIMKAVKPILDEENFDATFPFYGYLARLWYHVATSHAQTIYKKKISKNTDKSNNNQLRKRPRIDEP